MALDMARQLDPARWFFDAGIPPDDWQERAIRSTSKDNFGSVTGRQVSLLAPVSKP